MCELLPGRIRAILLITNLLQKLNDKISIQIKSQQADCQIICTNPARQQRRCRAAPGESKPSAKVFHACTPMDSFLCQARVFSVFWVGVFFCDPHGCKMQNMSTKPVGLTSQMSRMLAAEPAPGARTSEVKCQIIVSQRVMFY